jgi:glycosyltransferase involved in cell wall biosynthesis
MAVKIAPFPVKNSPMSTPLVTLSLPIYNAEPFLAEALLSIKAQTFGDFEVFAVLDGCTDRSEEILMELKDERFVVVKKDRNEGRVPATNLGLLQGHGEFFGRADADDILAPEKLVVQVDFLKNHPDVDIVGTYFDYINERGQQIRKAFPFPTAPEDIREGFKKFDCIGGPVALCRRQRLMDIGGYAEEFYEADDLALWLKCLAAGLRFANIPQVLFHYRLHGQQGSVQQKRTMLRLTNEAYRRYSVQIWGDNAPDVEFGAPLCLRAWSKLKKMIGMKAKRA